MLLLCRVCQREKQLSGGGLTGLGGSFLGWADREPAAGWEALTQLCHPGMLLYNGQKRIPGSTTNLAHRLPDFISFGLVGGRPEFR